MNTTTTVESATLEQVGRFLGSVSGLARNFQIYGDGHPRTSKSAEHYLQCVQKLAKCPSIDDELIIAYHDGRFFLEHVPLVVDRHDAYLFVAQLKANRMAGFRMKLRLPATELQAVLQLIAAQPGSTSGASARGVPGFTWLDRDEISRMDSAPSRENLNLHLILQLPELRVEEDVYLRTMGTLQVFMQECSETGGADIESIHRASDELVDQFVADPDRVMPLTTIPYADNFTFQHSLNVSLLTLKAASVLVSPEQLRRIGRVAIVHDIGKSAIPPEILYKPGKLTRAEAAVVMQHPVTGARMLSSVPGVDPLAPVVAFGHHIKDHGQGYPKVSPHYQIGPVTALVEVADIFEALTAQRPYKKAMTAADAFRILYSMPNMQSFRPHVDLLARAVGFQPVGSRVRDADDDVGIVVGHQDGDPHRPLVRPLEGEKDGNYRLGKVRLRSATLNPGSRPDADSIAPLDPDEDLARFA